MWREIQPANICSLVRWWRFECGPSFDASFHSLVGLMVVVLVSVLAGLLDRLTCRPSVIVDSAMMTAPNPSVLLGDTGFENLVCSLKGTARYGGSRVAFHLGIIYMTTHASPSPSERVFFGASRPWSLASAYRPALRPRLRLVRAASSCDHLPVSGVYFDTRLAEALDHEPSRLLSNSDLFPQLKG